MKYRKSSMNYNIQNLLFARTNKFISKIDAFLYKFFCIRCNIRKIINLLKYLRK